MSVAEFNVLCHIDASFRAVYLLRFLKANFTHAQLGCQCKTESPGHELWEWCPNFCTQTINTYTFAQAVTDRATSARLPIPSRNTVQSFSNSSFT